MTAKELNKALDNLFIENKNDILTLNQIVEILPKTPTMANSKKILSLSEKHKVILMSSSKRAETMNMEEAKKKQEDLQKLKDDDLVKEYDLLKNKELLEWSRSDSPVRMYLREMGQIQLLTKDEEIELSKRIEFGEDIIIDAVCAVPYLIDFILDYREPLINRERRVKELFKSFDDESTENDSENESEELVENNEKDLDKSAKNGKRVVSVTTAFKALAKAKKDWIKSLEIEISDDMDKITELHIELQQVFKQKQLKIALLELGPTSKLITEIVKERQSLTALEEKSSQKLQT